MAGSTWTCPPPYWYLECWHILRITSRTQFLRNVGRNGGGVFHTASGHPHGWVNVDLPALMVPGKLGSAEDHFKNSVFA